MHFIGNNEPSRPIIKPIEEDSDARWSKYANWGMTKH